jgi:hypothetical protein
MPNRINTYEEFKYKPQKKNERDDTYEVGRCILCAGYCIKEKETVQQFCTKCTFE